MKRVQVLLVGGFLGSGKTTLVRQLLNAAIASGQRLAVVSNEFGELGIDEALLESESQGFVEIAGGCVCCKLSDELSETLQDLYERVQPDCIAIETSGVALPSDAQLTLFRPPVSEWIADEAIVVVVNADQLADRIGQRQDPAVGEQDPLGEDLTFEFQVSAADLLLLNKVDLVDALEPLHAALEEMNPGVPIFETVQCQVAADLLFPPDAHRVRASRAAQDDHDHDHDHDHTQHFVSQVHDIPSGLTQEAATSWVAARQGLRTKGFVETTEGWQVIQGVGRRLEITPTATTPPEAVQNRLVVIEYRPH